MPYAIVMRPRARKQFLALDKPIRARVAAAIDGLADEPHQQATKIKNSDQWRLRVGNYRIVYIVDDDDKAVTVAWVGHRGRAYRDLS